MSGGCRDFTWLQRIYVDTEVFGRAKCFRWLQRFQMGVSVVDGCRVFGWDAELLGGCRREKLM